MLYKVEYRIFAHVDLRTCENVEEILTMFLNDDGRKTTNLFVFFALERQEIKEFLTSSHDDARYGLPLLDPSRIYQRVFSRF